MDYQIEIEEHAPQRYVTLEIECSPNEFEIEMEGALTEVWTLLDVVGVPPAGPPICLVPQIGGVEDEVPPASPWRLRVGFPVEEELEAEAPVFFGELPGGRVATTVHEGKLDSLSTAYLALQIYFQAHDLQPNGMPWEVYLTDPVWEPDPEKWRTIVRWAVQ